MRIHTEWINHYLSLNLCKSSEGNPTRESSRTLRSRDHCPLLEDLICFDHHPLTLEHTLKIITRTPNRKMKLDSQTQSHMVGVGCKWGWGGGRGWSHTIQFIGLLSNKHGNESTMSTNINKQPFLFTYWSDRGRQKCKVSAWTLGIATPTYWLSSVFMGLWSLWRMWKQN